MNELHVSLEALRRNASALRDLVGPGHAAFVVKGNAYGHGLVETALAIEPFAARFCTYTVREAIELRDGGVTQPVLVLGPIDLADLDDAVAAKTEIALWDTKEFSRRLSASARKRQARARVHVKVNTGLNRLGFEPAELVDALEDFLRVPEIEITGIFSHLASAEEMDSPYTMHQLDVFGRALASAAPIFAKHEIEPARHIAASAASMLWPATRLDMSRFGIALYGLWPSPQTRQAFESSNPGTLALEPALSYTSELIVVRSIAAGSPVGYGASFHAPRDMRIGVVPAGYADGVPRLLSNRGAFLVDGHRCPIVGRVAMNMTEIDITDVPSARTGARVTLIGRDGAETVTADDWAAWSDTINYEIVTRLPAELPRDYSTAEMA